MKFILCENGYAYSPRVVDEFIVCKADDDAFFVYMSVGNEATTAIAGSVFDNRPDAEKFLVELVAKLNGED